MMCIGAETDRSRERFSRNRRNRETAEEECKAMVSERIIHHTQCDTRKSVQQLVLGGYEQLNMHYYYLNGFILFL